jgi:tetratricopeptide (TPR) repeat protein
VINPDNRTLVVGSLGSTRCWHLPAPPTSLDELQSRTAKTLGIRLDENGTAEFVPRPVEDVAEMRRRLTEGRPPSRSSLDAALELPPAEAATALENLSKEFPDHTVYRQLAGRQHLALRDEHANRGRWQQALDHATEAIRLGSDEPPVQFAHALLSLKAGDVGRYQERCHAMLNRWRSTHDPDAIRWVAAAVALRPATLDDYEALTEQVRRSMSLSRGAYGPPDRFYLGAVLFRAGRYADAADEFEGVRRYLQATGSRLSFHRAFNTLLLAICQAKLGQGDAARRSFETAATETRNLAGEPWGTGLILELLRAEAAAQVPAFAPLPQP